MTARKPTSAPPSPRAGGYRTFFFFLVVALVALNWWLWRMAATRDTSGSQAKPITPYHPEADAVVYAGYAGSFSCQPCHSQAYERWTNSHHALAERLVNPVIDRSAFTPARVFKHGTQTSEARESDAHFEVVTLGSSGQREAFVVPRVIGVSPLRQFLVAAPRGQYQVTEIATDAATGDWFDVYGDENRQPGEWGHWTGRGMSWNSMCAFCHNTRVRKNYDPVADAYATGFKEHGVGCESCHGPLANHVAWQQQHPQQKKGDPTLRRFTPTQMLETCGSCHARRTELTGDFHVGERFFDHYRLAIADDTDTFYPDGQVREEDFEFAAFLASRMHLKGVTCLECHDPHTGKTLLPDNALCLKCHLIPIAQFPTAPKIDPVQHSFHKPNTPGDRCVDCHMPQTVYMARHWRHDHGFTIPDPLLTQQHNIPNACNRCHQDQTADWSLAACEKWYGSRMNRPTRERAQWIAQARAGATNAPAKLMRILSEEPISLWRAVAAGLLKGWVAESTVATALTKSALDSDPLVRAMAVHSLELASSQVSADVEPTLRRLLVDPFRAVRVQAAWNLRRTIEPSNVAAQDLWLVLEHNRDQPSGLLQLGVWHLDRGDTNIALACFQRAVEWDKGSAPLHHAWAVALSLKGPPAEAVRELEIACRLAPREAEYRCQLGLALNEAGRLPDATTALEEAVKLNPQFSRAWYNLGLAYSAQALPERALAALTRAESLDPVAPQIPYARAIVLARRGEIQQARVAARRALELQPSYADAERLLRSLSE